MRAARYFGARGLVAMFIAIGLVGCAAVEHPQDDQAPDPEPTGPGAVTAACEARGGDPIVDAQLAAAIRTLLRVETGPSCDDLARLTHLSAYDLGVKTLAGLEYAPELRSLAIGRNEVSSLAPLSQTVSLRFLYADENRISDLAPLEDLVELEVVVLGGNPITSLEPLRNMTELRVLDLGYEMQVTDTSPLYGKPKLSHVMIGAAGLRDLDFLAGAENLTSLFVSGNDITDAGVLAAATNLVTLDLGFNAISDFSFLANLANLGLLMVPGNPVTDTAPFASLTNLRFLSLIDTGIRDIAFVAGYTKLETFISCDNGLADLTPLEALPMLSYVNVSFNAVADITPLGRNEALGEGTEVLVYNNCLDLAPGSANAEAIEALRARGAIVVEHPQSFYCSR